MSCYVLPLCLNDPPKIHLIIFENFTDQEPLLWGFFCCVLACFAVLKDSRTLRAKT